MTFITVMEWIGTIAFAISGAVLAIEKHFDYYGICFLGLITAVGGGIIRDLLIGQHLPSAIEDPVYTIVSIITSVLVIIFFKHVERFSNLVAIADAFGLGAFTAVGAHVATANGHTGIFAIVAMAVLTGTFGGVLRDVFAKEIPSCFRKEVYAAACIAGAVVYSLVYGHLGTVFTMYVCFGVTLAIRLFAIYKNLHLPKVITDKESCGC